MHKYFIRVKIEIIVLCKITKKKKSKTQKKYVIISRV